MNHNAQLALLRLAFATSGRFAPALAAMLARRLFMRPPRHPIPERELAFRASGRPLLFSGGLKARAWGSGPPVLLVHGWAGRGTQLSAFVEPLVREGFQPVALDGPAHGDSPGRETEPLAFSRALVEVGRELGPLAGAVGHSFGGACVALAAAAGLEAERVVLIAAPASSLGVLERFAAHLWVPPAATRAFIAAVERAVGQNVAEVDLLRIVPRLSRPALIVHDRDDPEVPFFEAQALARVWPGARLLEVRGPGHRRVLRDAAVVEAVVAFVAEGKRGVGSAVQNWG